MFLNLQKAFDTVSHHILATKLNNAGIRGNSLHLIQNYLQDRLQTVRIKDTLSTPIANRYGIPQGTVLGPLLFLIYMNDLCELPLDCIVISFADDTVLYFEGETWTDVFKTANDTINTVKKWLDQHLLTLNIQKTQYITFSINNTGQPQNTYTIKIHETKCNAVHCSCSELKRVKSIRYLGVIIDNHLKWDEHIKLTATRIRHHKKFPCS